MSAEEAKHSEEVPEDAVDPQMPGPKEPIETRKKRKISRFQEIYTQITTSKDAVQFIENYQKDFANIKTGTLALFLQAFAGHSAEYYGEFFSDVLSKPHALFLLEKSSETYGVQAKGATYGTLAPFLLEFVLRCEAGGMAQTKKWMENVPAPMLGQDSLPLTSAKEMLAQLSDKDTKGKAHRRVEIVSNLDELVACCEYMTKDDVYTSVGCGDVTNVLTKLFSKCRKVVSLSAKPVKVDNMFSAPDKKKEGIRQKRDRDGELEDNGEEGATEKKLIPCPEKAVQAMVSMFEVAFVQKKVPPPPKFATFVEWMRRGEVSAESEKRLAEVEAAVSKLGDVEADQLELVMTLKSCGDTPADFIQALKVVCKQTVKEPEPESDDDAEADATPPKEEVAHAAQGGDGNNMFTALSDLPEEDNAPKAPPAWAVPKPDPIVLDEVLKLTSPDVLSALAVAANKVKEGVHETAEGDDEEGDEQKRVVEEKPADEAAETPKEGMLQFTCKQRAIKLLEKVATSGVTLPRRAMTLVMEERAKERRKRQGPAGTV